MYIQGFTGQSQLVEIAKKGVQPTSVRVQLHTKKEITK